MQLHIYKEMSQIGNAAALLFTAKIIKKPNCVLGMATGSTPLPTYNSLVELYKQGIVNFNDVRTFNLDEYLGIDIFHEQSYYRFMSDNLFSKVNINLENVKFPSAKTAASESGEVSYDAMIDAAGGIDLQILGIGNNGHIAFNEPCGVFPFKTHMVELTESTIEANKRFFNSAAEVPKKAVTMGIGTIMKAKEIMLIATGKGKAEAVRDMIKGEVNPMCPASVLQLHPKTTIFLDNEAASLL